MPQCFILGLAEVPAFGFAPLDFKHDIQVPCTATRKVVPTPLQLHYPKVKCTMITFSSLMTPLN
jgi:hypothetical protein